MTVSPPSVVLYRYDASPFSVKIDNILLLKNIPHFKVDVESVLPRPEITDHLGLTYRRIPVLAIGNDIYCDTSLISSTLERRFPTSKGYGSIFPPKKHGGSPDTGLLKAFTKHYADAVLFAPAPGLLPWAKFPASFVEDRRTLWPVDVQALMKAQGKSASALIAHLTLVNEQLQDGREWLFDTELPSLADIGIHFVFDWVRTMRGTAFIFDEAKVSFAMNWLRRMNKHIETARRDFPPAEALAKVDAAQLIASSDHEPYDVVGFDTVEASRLELKKGEVVAMIPDDTGPRFATIGKLVALNQDEFTIETKGTLSNVHTYHCHFPRIGFTAKPFQTKL